MSITPKLKKPIESMTKLERERALKRLRGETEELIDEMGHPDEKRAVPLVQKVFKERNEEEQKQREIDIEILKTYSSNRLNYQRYLIILLHRFIKEETIPKNYSLYVDSSNEGIALGISGTTLISAFKLCGIPFYDMNACKILAVQLGNTIGKLEGYVNKTDAGVIIPDALDKKKWSK